MPDSTIYAFNPNYVRISLPEQSGVVKLGVADTGRSYSIDVTLFNGSAQCYVSRLLQLLFDDYVNTRQKAVTFTLTNEDGTTLGSEMSVVLWAAVEAGMSYGYYLPVAEDVNWAMRSQKREVVWFTKLPQKVSYFNGSQILDVSPSDGLDGITFTKCDDMDGTYLRWLDNYGFWQYFLFDTGKRKSKNKLGSTVIDAEYTVSGVTHHAERTTHISNTDTVTCCAVSLKKEVLAYVETIYKSPHIEVYVGKVSGVEVWKPVNIASGTVTVEADTRLYDYEISFTMPENQVQTI